MRIKTYKGEKHDSTPRNIGYTAQDIWNSLGAGTEKQTCLAGLASPGTNST